MPLLRFMPKIPPTAEMIPKVSVRVVRMTCARIRLNVNRDRKSVQRRPVVMARDDNENDDSENVDILVDGGDDDHKVMKKTSTTAIKIPTKVMVTITATLTMMRS